MTTELVPSASPVVVAKGDEIEVSAATPNEMASSQDALIAWAKRKVALTTAEADELGASFEEAKKRKWKSTTLLRHFRLALKRVEFYQKVLSALEHGYIIVPTFPVEIFAVRTDMDKPRGFLISAWDQQMEQEPKPLAEGQGEYRNPFPVLTKVKNGTTDGTHDEFRWVARDWEEMEFPINMSKPNIMQATDRAMAAKIFDDFGVLPATKRFTPSRSSPDPVIIGRIKVPNNGPYANDRVVSFIVAWHLDTKSL